MDAVLARVVERVDEGIRDVQCSLGVILSLCVHSSVRESLLSMALAAGMLCFALVPTK